ncbi:MAG: Rap1a/Tai family immunity protein [Proteobacteria bacterium]|nr:Rap1a/Tai family immunity protein [Pseudomonadota bacterium]
MFRLKYFLTLLTLLLSLNATAQFKSGNDLKRDLEDSGFSAGFGFGFVIGVVDVSSILNYICLPSGESGVRAGQVKEVVLKYLRAHPETLHRSAADLVYLSVLEVWPCPKKIDSSSGSSTPTPMPKSRPKVKPKEQDASPF